MGGAGVQPSLSAVLPVLLGGLELLRSGESWNNKQVIRKGEKGNLFLENVFKRKI